MSLMRLSAAQLRGLVSATALVALAACNIQFGTGIEATETWTKNYKVSANATFEVLETTGKIHVTGGDGSEIRVTATKHAKASNEEAAKTAAKEVAIKESATADRVSLDSRASGQISIGQSRWVDYDVVVPRGASVTIKTTNGEVKVRDIGGLLQVETTNGEIDATGLSHGADISAVNGVITLEMTAIGSAGVRCKLINGEVIVRVPRDTKASVSARITNGPIEVENLDLPNAERRRLDAPLNGGGPEIRLEATNGEIRLVGR
jgi:DUF4097 and DUF4098 domain-containing protein YvlB